MKINTNPEVELVFQHYPNLFRNKLLDLRKIIIETAKETKEITDLEETVKWGEPGYLVKKGSTIRIAWKEKNPDQYGIYFKCTSKLVPTFRLVYGSIFRFEGNRAIIFKLDDEIPKPELIKCITSALLYHKVKNLPFLGIYKTKKRVN